MSVCFYSIKFNRWAIYLGCNTACQCKHSNLIWFFTTSEHVNFSLVAFSLLFRYWSTAASFLSEHLQLLFDLLTGTHLNNVGVGF